MISNFLEAYVSFVLYRRFDHTSLSPFWCRRFDCRRSSFHDDIAYFMHFYYCNHWLWSWVLLLLLSMCGLLYCIWFSCTVAGVFQINLLTYAMDAGAWQLTIRTYKVMDLSMRIMIADWRIMQQINISDYIWTPCTYKMAMQWTHVGWRHGVHAAFRRKLHCENSRDAVAMTT